MEVTATEKLIKSQQSSREKKKKKERRSLTGNESTESHKHHTRAVGKKELERGWRKSGKVNDGEQDEGEECLKGKKDQDRDMGRQHKERETSRAKSECQVERNRYLLLTRCCRGKRSSVRRLLHPNQIPQSRQAQPVEEVLTWLETKCFLLDVYSAAPMINNKLFLTNI